MNATKVSVSSPAGTITGVQQNGLRFFHSIAYAHFPSPFRDATPAPAGDVDATRPHPERVALSITAPENAFDAPVLVFIHGGGFTSGTHADPRTSGRQLAAHNIVTVNVGYRLGVAGMATFHDDEPAHYRAVSDANLALEWVQRNIVAFGGDPTRVTLMGHSAGATIVTWLARRDHFRGAFRRAFAASPAFPRASWQQRKGTFRTILAKPMLRETLEKVPPQKLQRAEKRFQQRYFSDLAFGPHPLEVDELSDVSLLITSTREEFYNHPAAQRLRGGVKEKLALKPMRKIMGVRDRNAWDGDMGALIGDSTIRRFVDEIAHRNADTWMAEFIGSGPVTHGDELDMLFGADPTFVEYLTTGALPWPSFSHSRAAARWNVEDGSLHTVNDPLRHVREGFRA